ncbi:MAG: glycosyltransferase family 61 protein [Proteobacteria bacterium]|nr:glycosyltransferase family 61 protein [Pseudomonadota bacterium]
MTATLKRVLTAPVRKLCCYGKEILRWPSKLLQRIFTRRVGLILFAPHKALKAACKTPAQAINGNVRLTSGIPIWKNVIAYPLIQTRRENHLGEYFYGGLAESATRTLIQESIHYNGVAYCQSLPPSYIDKYSLDACPEIRQPVLYGGILYNHFAHFVCECLCRLYAYPLVRDIDPYLLFYAPWGLPKYLENGNFVNQVLTGFGIPSEKVVFIDQISKIREIMIPPQEYGYGFLHRPAEIFVEFARSFRFGCKVPKGFEEADKIFVARSGLRKMGSQIGENMFQDYLVKEGYKVFYPERYTLFEQLTVYTRAKRVIFSEGGAIQACILLPDLEAEVAVICRRRDPLRNIPVATACLQGYGKRILWIDVVRGQYQFGLDTWEALADIDWYETSRLLRDHGFVDRPYCILADEDHSSLVRSELREYLQEISSDPRFIDHMTRYKETYPLWTGPSHLIDPRDGFPVP